VPSVRNCSHYNNSRLYVFPSALIACLLTGCWEEVHYAGPVRDTSTAPPPLSSTSPSNFQSNAHAFADELARSLSNQTPAISAVPTASSTPNVGDRYRTSPTDIENSTPNAFPLAEENLNKGFNDAASAEPEVNTATAAKAQPIATTPTETRPTNPPADAGRVTELPIVSQTVEPQPAEPQQPPTREARPQAPTEEPASMARQTNPAKTRRAVWLLGSKWSLGILARDRGAAANTVNAWLSQASELAERLGVSMGEPPDVSNSAASTESQKAESPAVRFLFVEGQRLGRELAARHGPDHAALFELAVKSNLLLVLYMPGSQTAESISGAISQARERAGIPIEIVQPLLKTTVERYGSAAVRQAVYQMHEEVDRHLAEAAERAKGP
jgi:hypothetical protein